MIGSVIVIATLNDTMNYVERLEVEQCQRQPEKCQAIVADNLQLVEQLERLYPTKKETK